MFFINAILFGIGLAMDAFSVSLANGLKYPDMRKRQIFTVAAVFALFQGIMPLTGWFLVTGLIGVFNAISPYIPYIALLLLCYIGGKMIYDGFHCECEECGAVGLIGLMVQGVATSIDALSVGFTIAEYDLPMALVAALLIAAVTFVICLGGIAIGKKFGTKLAGKASIFGGVILIAIGIEIFLTGVL